MRERSAMGSLIRFYGVYEKTLMRDEKTGMTVFRVSTEDKGIDIDLYGRITCEGVIPSLPSQLPLELTGRMREDRFRVSSTQECSENREDAVAFLSGKSFEGIGPAKAERIVDACGEDIFDFAEGRKAVDTLTTAGISAKDAFCAVSVLRKIRSARQVLERVTALGGSYEDAMRLHRRAGTEALNILSRKPFALSGMLPFRLCDAVHREKGGSPWAKDRIHALLGAAVEANERKGHTRVPIKDVFATAARIAGNDSESACALPFFLAAGLQEDPAFGVDADKEVYAYRTLTREMEKQAALHTARLMNTSEFYDTNRFSIEEVEGKTGMHYSNEQKDALRLMEQSGIGILTGSPGTGKTSTTALLIEKFFRAKPDGRLALCAPTGCAAKRIEEATGRQASTVAKLIDMRPFGDSFMSRDESDPLPYDLIIADEWSMADTESYCRLVRAIPSGAHLLLVGDEDQLQSIGPGSVLHDLIMSERIPVCRLTHSFRQDGDTSLTQNRIRIQSGMSDLVEDEQSSIRRFSDTDAMVEEALDIYRKALREGREDQIRIFSPVRQRSYDTGTVSMNANIQDLIDWEDVPSIRYGDYTFHPGDRVLFNTNDYIQGYMNGDTGIILNIAKGDECVVTVSSGDTEYTLSGSEISRLELCYAVTVHKAQGGECDEAVILLPESPAWMLERSLLYVAATRARKKNTFLVQGDALAQAIRTDRKHDRHTALLPCIEEAFRLYGGLR